MVFRILYAGGPTLLSGREWNEECVVISCRIVANCDPCNDSVSEERRCCVNGFHSRSVSRPPTRGVPSRKAQSRLYTLGVQRSPRCKFRFTLCVKRWPKKITRNLDGFVAAGIKLQRNWIGQQPKPPMGGRRAVSNSPSVKFSASSSGFGGANQRIRSTPGRTRWQC